MSAMGRRSLVAVRARHNRSDDPDGLVVEGAAAAEVGGAGAAEYVGVAVFAEVAAFGHQRDVAALASIVANLNWQISDGGFEAGRATVRDSSGRVGMHGDQRRAGGLALAPLRVL